jgi:hypothetical protein
MHPHHALATVFAADLLQNPQKSGIGVDPGSVLALFCRIPRDRQLPFFGLRRSFLWLPI